MFTLTRSLDRLAGSRSPKRSRGRPVSGAWMLDRSSRPRGSLTRLRAGSVSAGVEPAGGPRLVAGEISHPHSTIGVRHGISRAPRFPPAATSGLARATCCTWTSLATGVSNGQAMLSGDRPPTQPQLDGTPDRQRLRLRAQPLARRASSPDTRSSASSPGLPAQTNGKIERLAYRSHHHRNHSLPHRGRRHPPPAFSVGMARFSG